MVERKDGFEISISQQNDEAGHYVGMRVDVRHLETGDSTSFWADHLRSLNDVLRRCEANEKQAAH